MNTCILEILDWSGSIGGEHFTGTLHYKIGTEHKTTKLEKKMTASEARQFNRKGHDTGHYCGFTAGHKTDRFSSRYELRKFAIAHWREYAAESDILVCGNYVSGSCQEVLEGPRKRELNALWRRWEKIGGYQGSIVLASELDRRYRDIIQT